MIWAVNHQHVNMGSQVPSQACLCGMYGGQSGTFLYVAPYHSYFTSARYSCSARCNCSSWWHHEIAHLRKSHWSSCILVCDVWNINFQYLENCLWNLAISVDYFCYRWPRSGRGWWSSCKYAYHNLSFRWSQCRTNVIIEVEYEKVFSLGNWKF